MKVRSRFGYRFFSSRFIERCLLGIGKIIGVFKNARVVYIGLIGLIIAVGIIWGIDIRIEKSKAKKASVQSAENIKILEDLGNLVDLPTNETPVIATVMDKSKLSDEPFFVKAENEDVVVIYPTNKIAYIYRPSSHKIIDFTRVALADNATGDSQGMTTTKDDTTSSNTDNTSSDTPLKMKIFNGNETADYASVMEPVISEKYAGKIIVTKSGLTTGRYGETLVCMVDEKFRKMAEEVALMSGGIINNCPAGEDTTGADIVLILAQ